MLTANTSPGTLLYIVRPVAIYEILQVAQPETAVVSINVILKLLELPKNLGLPSPDKLSSRNPLGAEFASICKLYINKDWNLRGTAF